MVKETKFDLDGSDETEENLIDWKVVAEELQKRLYSYEKVIRTNGLDSEIDKLISDEEYICMNGIDTIKTLVTNKTFTKDDINMFDVLYRNMNTIRGIKVGNKKQEKPKSHAELLQLVKKQ